MPIALELTEKLHLLSERQLTRNENKDTWQQEN